MANRLELGSEFNISLNDIQAVEDDLFWYLSGYDVQWYDYGRSAIRNIPIPKGKAILLPGFICRSVIECFDKALLRFYRIDDRFDIDMDDLLGKIDDTVGCIYITHYFGYLQKQGNLDMVRVAAKDRGIVIIEDTTQSLFSRNRLIGDYAISSIRKWMAIPMGGILYTHSGGVLPEISSYAVRMDNTKAYGMILKDMFLKNHYDTNSKYREIFAESEMGIDGLTDICTISDFTRFLIGCVSINRLIEKRRNNAERLSSGLKQLGIQRIRESGMHECLLAYPIRVRNRDAFRAYLMDNRIYCAVHWPFDGFRPEERAEAIVNAGTLLSLPIDQRYGEKEMDYLLDVISKYGGELSF